MDWLGRDSTGIKELNLKWRLIIMFKYINKLIENVKKSEKGHNI